MTEKMKLSDGIVYDEKIPDISLLQKHVYHTMACIYLH